MARLKINQNCFLWHNNTSGIFYNSESGKTFKFCKNPAIQNDCKKIDDIVNLYSVGINEQAVNNPEYDSWLRNLVKLQIGEILPDDVKGYDRISLPPTLKIQKDIRKYKGSDSASMLESELLTYLHEVSFQFGEETASEPFFKQVNYPICYESWHSLNLIDIKKAINQITSINLKKINLIGANLFTQDDFNEIISAFNSVDAVKTIIITSDSLPSILKFIPGLMERNYKLQIICTPETGFQEIENTLLRYGISYSFVVLILSESDYKISVQKYNDLKTEDCSLKPIYTGDNLDFFKENIFIGKNDVMEPGLSKRAVFANQVLNDNFFGKLTIMPGGEVYANVNQPPLGNIQTDTVYDMLLKELNNSSSWLFTRDTVKPCSGCLYRYLCPPPSNYELVIGQPNLCTIIE